MSYILNLDWFQTWSYLLKDLNLFSILVYSAFVLQKLEYLIIVAKLKTVLFKTLDVWVIKAEVWLEAQYLKFSVLLDQYFLSVWRLSFKLESSFDLLSNIKILIYNTDFIGHKEYYVRTFCFQNDII